MRIYVSGPNSQVLIFQGEETNTYMHEDVLNAAVFAMYWEKVLRNFYIFIRKTELLWRNMILASLPLLASLLRVPLVQCVCVCVCVCVDR